MKSKIRLIIVNAGKSGSISQCALLAVRTTIVLTAGQHVKNAEKNHALQ